MNSIYGGLYKGIVTSRELALREKAQARMEEEAKQRAEQAEYEKTLRPTRERALGLQLTAQEEQIAGNKAARERATAAAGQATEFYEYGKSKRRLMERGVDLGLTAKEQAIAGTKAAGERAAAAETRAQSAFGLNREATLNKLQQQKMAIRYLRQADFLESTADPDASWPVIQSQFGDVLKDANFTDIASTMNGTIQFVTQGTSPEGKPISKVREYKPDELLQKADKLRVRAAVTLNPANAVRGRTGKTAEQVAQEQQQKALMYQIGQFEKGKAALQKMAAGAQEDQLPGLQASIDDLTDKSDIAQRQLHKGVGLNVAAPTVETDISETEATLANEKGRKGFWGSHGFWGNTAMDEEKVAELEQKIAKQKARSAKIRGLDEAGIAPEPTEDVEDQAEVPEDVEGTKPTPHLVDKNIPKEVQEAIGWLKTHLEDPRAPAVRAKIKQLYGI